MPPNPGQPGSEISSTAPLTVLDPAGTPSNLIIRRSDPFQVAMEFELLASGVSQALLGTMEYQVQYFAESIGPGPDVALGSVTRKTVAGQRAYSDTAPAAAVTTRNVPANTLPAGIYRLGAVVSFTIPAAPTPTRLPVTAFADGPTIQIFE
ncbi:MAG TPA: hypothetical protein VFV66_17810 [Nonomuraea sp.]|nr:hypothetical protein [Nonomuraea sp.]